LNNYHIEIQNANNFISQIILSIVDKTKNTLNCLQYNNVTIDDVMLPLEEMEEEQQPLPCPPMTSRTFAKSKDRKHECKICKKSFYSLWHLKTHNKSHEEERPFGCELCSDTFKFKNSLRLHMRSHTTEKAFKCDVCDACFKSKEGLINHSSVHDANAKPFECQYCHLKFVLKKSLAGHMVNHVRPNRYKCPYDNCGKLFTFKQLLSRHVKIHTGKIYLLSLFKAIGF